MSKPHRNPKIPLDREIYLWYNVSIMTTIITLQHEKETTMEHKLSKQRLEELWASRDESFKSYNAPKELISVSISTVDGQPRPKNREFTVGHEPINEYGHGWYPYSHVIEINGNWYEERVTLRDHF